MKALLLFGLFDSEESLPGLGAMSPVMRERILLVGAILFVVIVVFAWLLMFHKYNKHRSGRQGNSHRSHRRHHGHRHRNPTLAETGGLPPLRNGAPIEPPQSRVQSR